ncbi:MAG: ATP-binding protein [Bacillota bacterium]
MSNDSQILEDSIFKIGKVVSVDGRTIKIKVDKTKNTSHLLYKGELLKNISVGGYIKIVKGFTKIIGKVEGEFTSEDPTFSKKDYVNEKERINRILAVSLLGFFKGDQFERGIKELPLVGNECYLLPNREFNEVHNFIRGDDDPIAIGRLALEKGQDISVGVNSLFASHIGIFGNTGSGKSYTLAKIYHELFKFYKDQSKFFQNAKFFLIDFNGEYTADDEEADDIIVESKHKRIYKLSTRATTGKDKYPITKEALNEASFWTVFLEATEKTQAPFLVRALEGGFTRQIFENVDTTGSPNANLREKIASFVEDVLAKNDKSLGARIFVELFSDLRASVNDEGPINTIMGLVNNTLDFNSTNGTYFVRANGVVGNDRYSAANISTHFTEPVRAQINLLEFTENEIAFIRLKIIIKYYDEIFKGYSNRDHISPLLKRLDTKVKDLIKVVAVKGEQEEETNQRNLTIVSLKDVNIHIRKILPLLLCKNLYDEKKELRDGNSYLNIIVDEAHNILSDTSDRESEQWKDYRLETFEEIIKEGRKFGVFLTIASQRPADISPTIISQLHNYFLHRLINNNDIYAIEKTISYLDKVSFEYLPILPTGTCILAGLLAQVPVVVDIGKIPTKYEPRNKTMTLSEKWKDEDVTN